MPSEENHTEPELRVQISLFIPKSLKKRIAQHCIDHDTTQTVIVTEAIQDWFAKNDPMDPEAGRHADNAVRYGMLIAGLTAEERTIFHQYAEDPFVTSMDELVESLESSGDPRARSLAARIRQEAGDEDA